MSSSHRVTRKVLVPARDGVRLATDLWLPDTDVPGPAVLFRTPYDRSAYNTDVLRPQQCVEAGFAAIVQDMRGRFGSEGEWLPLNWPAEAEDTYDVVEWIAAQPWCSGAVGMSGLSYGGTAQLLASQRKPPHLKAIAPAMASSQEFDRVESGGALRLDLAMSWLAFTSVDWANRHGEVPEVAEVILRAILDPRFLCLVRPLRNIPLFAIDGFPITFDELYSRSNHPAHSNGVDLQIPTLHIGGWYDFSHSTAVNLFCRQAAAGNQDSHLVMGPWTHSSQLPQTQGQVNFGALASAAASRLPELVLAFFRRHLANETVQIPRVKYFLMNAGNWREDRTWPPEAAKPRHLYLGKAGALTDWRPDDESASDQYLYDPNDPTPTVGGRNLGVGCLRRGRSARRRSSVARICCATPVVPSLVRWTSPVPWKSRFSFRAQPSIPISSSSCSTSIRVASLFRSVKVACACAIDQDSTGSRHIPRVTRRGWSSLWVIQPGGCCRAIGSRCKYRVQISRNSIPTRIQGKSSVRALRARSRQTLCSETVSGLPSYSSMLLGMRHEPGWRTGDRPHPRRKESLK